MTIASALTQWGSSVYDAYQVTQAKLEWEAAFTNALSSTTLSSPQGVNILAMLTDISDDGYAITASCTSDGSLTLDIIVNTDNTTTTTKDCADYVVSRLASRNVTTPYVTMAYDGTANLATVLITAAPSDDADANKIAINLLPTSSAEAAAAGKTVSTPVIAPVKSSTKILGATQAVAATTIIDLYDTMSTSSNMLPKSDAENTSVFFLEVEIYLEGVQVPHNSCAVSYGLNSPASCSIIIPASSVIRDLPETTKVHIFFKDLIPDANGVYEWRLLFDGELRSFSYTSTANGGTISIEAIHSSAYLSLMKILTLDAAEYIYNPNPRTIGDATMPMLCGQSKINSKLVQNIIKGKNYSSMADLVFQLMRAVIEGVSDSAIGKYYASKLGPGAAGWKLTKRIFGVSKLAGDAAVAKYETQYTVDTGKLTTSSKTDTASFGKASPTADTLDSSKYYVKSDFQSANDSWKDSEWPGMNKELLNKLDDINDKLKVDFSDFGILAITSGFRSSRYNANVPGASTTSMHTRGMAVDVAVPTSYIDGAELVSRAHRSGMRCAVFYYNDGFVHMDVGEDDFNPYP